jgi:glycosyltransferase involved in cell wall biosynthesis
MRVAIDTSVLYTTQAGMARYIRGMIEGLRALNPADCEFLELGWPVENFAYQQPQRALKTVYREFLWAPWLAPAELRRRGADVLHSTNNYFVPPPRGVRNVITIPDVAFLRHPERFRRWQLWNGTRRLRKAAGGDLITCISRFSADEAIALLGLQASRVHVTYCGCEYIDKPPAERAPAFEVPPEFFLFVGSLEPGKNLALLRQVYELAARRGETLPPLMIVGARWVGTAEEGQPPAQWHYLGRQPDEVLVHLYRRARALLFPSKYEGFGLPVVEAMALDCPVICARIASLPEVGGDAACYVALEPEDYLKGVLRVLREPSYREDLVGRGRVQCRRFSLRRCAEDTLAVYRLAHARS